MSIKPSFSPVPLLNKKLTPISSMMPCSSLKLTDQKIAKNSCDYILCTFSSFSFCLPSSIFSLCCLRMTRFSRSPKYSSIFLLSGLSLCLALSSSNLFMGCTHESKSTNLLTLLDFLPNAIF